MTQLFKRQKINKTLIEDKAMKPTRHQGFRLQGFTLIELLVVIRSLACSLGYYFQWYNKLERLLDEIHVVIT